ncbi:MAG TPA: hypothetical protein VI756_13120, partial [Blastocatellia bacterium]
EEDAETFFRTFGHVPFIISAHDEGRDWKNLKRAVHFLNDDTAGIGLPMGSGLVYHPNHTIEVLRGPLYEFLMKNGEITVNLLFSPDWPKQLLSGEEVSDDAQRRQPK